MKTVVILFFFQAEDGIRDLVRSRGLGDVYKRQLANIAQGLEPCLYLGNMDALRDWGHARDYVRMQLSLIHI